MTPYTVRGDVPGDVFNGTTAFSPLLRELLYHRDITTDEEAEAFLNPDYETQLHDPFLMKDMDRAVARIFEAIEKNEHIVLYTDYDHDGTPAGALLYDFFTKIGYENFSNHIPHRHRDGFGLNKETLARLADEGAQLIITADCGISQVDEVAHANERGIDVIITDHHLPIYAEASTGKQGEKLPEAYAIVNPKREGDEYPFKDLCGAGVAFKLVQALIKKGNFNIVLGWEKWLLDLVAIATIGDMMPLRGENRVLVHFGLIVLRRTARPGLRALMKRARVNQAHISETDVAFMVVPRINAASRMATALDAFELLTTKSPAEAQDRAAILKNLNKERKTLTATTVKEMKARLKKGTTPREVIVMGNPKWSPPILGLAAMSIVEEYNRPVFLWGRDELGKIKGSCRAPEGSVNVVALMQEVSHLFIDYGGHKYSGGFAMEQEHVHHLEEEFLKVYETVAEGLEERLPVQVDKTLSLDDVTEDTYRTIAKLAPYGEGNPVPAFLFEQIEIAGIQLFGKHEEHLKLVFKRSDESSIEAIQFFAKNTEEDALEMGKRINLIASFDKSYFRFKPELRLRIVGFI